MKKMFAALLALCLLCGAATALAENKEITQNGSSANTEVQYTVGQVFNFTVKIPPSVQMTGSAGEASGSLTVDSTVTSANVSKTISVKIGSGTKDAIEFKLQDDAGHSTVLTVKQGETDVKIGDTILTHTVDYTDNKTWNTSANLSLSAPFSADMPAGTYKETLTFTVNLSTTGTATIDPGFDDDNTVHF